MHFVSVRTFLHCSVGIHSFNSADVSVSLKSSECSTRRYSCSSRMQNSRWLRGFFPTSCRVRLYQSQFVVVISHAGKGWRERASATMFSDPRRY